MEANVSGVTFPDVPIISTFLHNLSMALSVPFLVHLLSRYPAMDLSLWIQITSGKWRTNIEKSQAKLF